MTTEPSVTVKIDAEAEVAYLRLGHGRVARTVEFAEDIFVDLDEYDVVLGIELLDLDTPLPLDELAERFHIQASTLELLVRAIQWGGRPSTLSSAGTPPAVQASFGTLVARELPASTAC